MLTIHDLAKIYPSLKADSARTRVMNSKPNLADGIPTVIPESAMQQGLEANFNQIVQAWHSKQRMEQTPPEDPSLAILRAFGGKVQNSADARKTLDFNAIVSNRWQTT
jgi:hypothetical protein